MSDRVRLKTFLTLFPISEEVVGVQGGFQEMWRIRLNGELAIQTLAALLPLLDGKHSLDEILARLNNRGIPQEAVQQLLRQLQDASLLEFTAESPSDHAEDDRQSDSQSAYLSRFASDGAAGFRRLLHDTPIAVLGDGEFAQTLCRQLSDSGFGELTLLSTASDRLTASFKHADGIPADQAKLKRMNADPVSIWPTGTDEALPKILLVPRENYNPNLLEAVDAFSKNKGVPWFLLQAHSFGEAWVGPLFIPEETPCYLSYEARLKGNIPYYTEYDSLTKFLRATASATANCGGLSVIFQLIGAMAVAETIKYVTGITVPIVAGRFITVNLSTWETELHEVLRIPRIDLYKAHNQPGTYAWKEMPYHEIFTLDESSIHNRRG